MLKPMFSLNDVFVFAMIRDSVMKRRLRRPLGIYIFSSCLERQKRNRRKYQS